MKYNFPITAKSKDEITLYKKNPQPKGEYDIYVPSINRSKGTKLRLVDVIEVKYGSGKPVNLFCTDDGRFVYEKDIEIDESFLNVNSPNNKAEAETNNIKKEIENSKEQSKRRTLVFSLGLGILLVSLISIFKKKNP